MTKVDKTVIKSLGFCSFGTGSNAMLVDVDSEADKIVRIRPFKFDEKYTPEEMNRWTIDVKGKRLEMPLSTLASPLSLAYKQRLYSKNRIPYPLKRVDWDPKGARNPQSRGTSKYERISWDEATRIIAEEIKRMHDEYGPEAIFIEYEGHGETKIVEAPHGASTKLFELIGGFTAEMRDPDSWEGWSWGARHVWGMEPYGFQSNICNVIPDVAQHSDAVLFWGCDSLTAPLGWTGQMPEKICYWWSELGVKQIHIAPDANYGNVVHADTWIPILPNTDAALQLALAYVWITEDTFDQAYLDTHAVGFDRFKGYVLGDEDGIPKTPVWASEKCGVPSCTIKALARYWAKHTVSIAHNYGGSYIRSAFAHEPARLEVVLLAMQGLGKPGANQFLFSSWYMFGTPDLNPLPSVKGFPNLAPAFRGALGTNQENIIPRVMLADAIMNPPISWMSMITAFAPKETNFAGPFTYPREGASRIHMYWTDTPCQQTNWNCGFKLQDALKDESIECVVVQHPWFENETLYADLILPTTTKFESRDIGSDTTSGQLPLLFLEEQAVGPLEEAMTERQSLELIAKKLEQFGGIYENLLERFTQGREVDDWIELGFQSSEVPADISFEEWKERKYYVYPTLENWDELPVGMSKFYEDPESNPLQTPSGKLEIYSEALAQGFPDDKERTGLPRWVEESDEHRDRISSERAEKYPFLLVSNHSHWRVHSEHDDMAWMREIETCKVVGPDGYRYEPVWIHPSDAEELGVVSGDIVKLFNERGGVLGGVIVTERTIPGVVNQEHGARVDPIVEGIGGLDRGGANNLISPKAPTSKNAPGIVTSSFLVGVEKVDVFELARQYPEAFNKPYDPDTGLVIDRYLA